MSARGSGIGAALSEAAHCDRHFGAREDCKCVPSLLVFWLFFTDLSEYRGHGFLQAVVPAAALVALPLACRNERLWLAFW